MNGVASTLDPRPSTSARPPFVMLQLPLADRLAGVLAVYLDKVETLTPAERAGCAALFAWFPAVLPVITDQPPRFPGDASDIRPPDNPQPHTG